MNNNVCYRCRLCRQEVFRASHLTTNKECHHCPLSTQIFIDAPEAPTWITQSIEKGAYSKGKLNCPQCKGRLGAFDFISNISCGCGQHVLPPVRILKSRVDLVETSSQQHGVLNSHKTSPPVKSGRKILMAVKNEATNEMQSKFDRRHSKKNSEISSDSTAAAVSGVSREVSVCHKTCSSETPPVGSYRQSETKDVNIFAVLDQEEVMEAEVVAESDSLADVDLDPLTCPVCLELFFLPQQCEPCKHVFCDPCLRQLNASTSFGSSVKCPLCRNLIKSCCLHKDFNDNVKSMFPDEHAARRKMVKKSKQSPLPGKKMSLGSMFRQRRSANGRRSSDNRMIFAGVCFLILLTMLGFTVFAVTVGFLSWYLLEVSIELVVDLTAELSTFFEVLRCVIILFCVDGMKQEYIQSLFNSSSRVLMAFAKVVRTDKDNSHTTPIGSDIDPGIVQQQIITDGQKVAASIQENITRRTSEFFMRMSTQSVIANYVVVGALVTYLLYRIAKYVQFLRADGR